MSSYGSTLGGGALSSTVTIPTGGSTFLLDDATNNANSDVLVLTHSYNAGAGANNIASGLLFRVESTTSGTIHDAIRLSAIATTDSVAGAVTALQIQTRTGGGSLTTTMTVAPTLVTVGGASVTVSGGMVTALTGFNSSGTGTGTGISVGTAHGGAQRFYIATNVAPTVASGASVTLRVVQLDPGTITISGATNITTTAGFNWAEIAQPSYSAASALTVSFAATLYVAGEPLGIGAGPATITASAAIKVASGSVVVGGAAIATNATKGFLYIPTCAGAPSGTPEVHTGTVAMVYDTTNHKLRIYDASWLGGTTPGAWV